MLGAAVSYALHHNKNNKKKYPRALDLFMLRFVPFASFEASASLSRRAVELCTIPSDSPKGVSVNMSISPKTSELLRIVAAEERNNANECLCQSSFSIFLLTFVLG